MTTSVLDLFPELLELAAFGVGSVLLSVVGAAIEQFAFTTLQSGNLILGAWAAFLGLVLLYFGYLVGTDKLLPKLDEVKHALGETVE